MAIFVLEMAYVVPLGTKPDQCADPITPHNMHSDASCGVSGFFLLFGGFGGVMWVFIRSLSVHLQICWKVVPGELFFYAAQVGGWGVTVLFVVLAMVMSGVSYRLGSTCYINHENSIGVYWGPLLAFAGLSLVLQLITFIYCIKVYLSVAGGPKALPSSNISGAQETTTSSGRSVVVKRATYRRVRKVIALQWRGMTVVVLVVITACYLATVFLLLDQDISRAYDDVQSIVPWVICLVTSQGSKETCQDLTSGFVLREQVVLPVPYLIVMCGIWCLFFLGRWGMVLGWRDLLMRPLQRNRRGSQSLRGQSQQSFRDRMRATPQQLHLIKGEDGLAVARKNGSMDIEMVSPTSPARDIESRDNDDDYLYALKEASFEHNVRPVAAPARARVPASLASIGGHTSFNFSRPSTAQQVRVSENKDTHQGRRATDSTKTSTSPVAAPRPALHSPFQSSSYSYHLSCPQRSASNASESWLMRDLEPFSNTVPMASFPRSASQTTERSGNAGRSASRSDAQITEPRASQGMAWDPTSSFASPVGREARRSASGSPVLERGYAVRGSSDHGQEGYV